MLGYELGLLGDVVAWKQAGNDTLLWLPANGFRNLLSFQAAARFYGSLAPFLLPAL